MTFADLLSRFDAVRPTGSGYSAKCPVHEDRVSSLSISQGDEDQALIHCHAGCPLDEILLDRNLTLSDLFPDDPVPVPTPAPVLTSASTQILYDYHGLDGTLLHQVVKGTGKQFRQRHPTPEGWVWKTSGRRVPYRWPELVGQNEVFICEGEKDVDCLFDHGLVATCNLGGASKWRAEETAALLDLNPAQVYVIPDHDGPGRAHADSVLEQLTAAGITATLVPLPGLQPHGDASDWFAAGGTAESLRALAADPETVLPPAVETVDLDMLTAPQEFTREGEDAYRLDYPTLGVSFAVAHLHRHHDDLKCELTVDTTLPQARTVNGTLLWTATNLSAARTRAGLAKGLAARSGEPKWDWLSALEILSVRVARAEAEGSSEIKPLADYDLPTDDLAWTISGLPILRSHPTILFGDGASGKSYLALWIAGTIARDVPVLYADFEFEAEAHRDRLQRLFGTGMPRDLHYVRCSQPIVNEVGRLQKHILEHGIGFIVVDSIAFALNGPPESAEIAAAFFRSLRTLNVGSLSLAHTTKSLEQSDQKPFGSTFFSNGARSVWHVKRNDDEGTGSSTVELALSHRKSNTGQRLSTRGIKLGFAGASTTVEPFDLAGSADLATALPIWQRVKSLVAHTPMTIPQLASELEARPDSIARIVRRMNMFRKDTSDRVCLAETTLVSLEPDEERF